MSPINNPQDHSKNPVLRNISNSSGGFSLAELVVVTAIIAIITIIAIFSYTQHQETASIDLAAEEIQLAIREAQSKAISVEAHEGNFSVGYGVFAENNTKNKEIILFVDSDGDSDVSTAFESNYLYNTPAPRYQDSEDEKIGSLNLPADISITDICAVELSDSGDTTSSTCRSVEELHIVFFRPSRQPFLNDNDAACPAGGNPVWSECSKYRYAEITLESDRTSRQRKIEIHETGRVDIINTTDDEGNDEEEDGGGFGGAR